MTRAEARTFLLSVFTMEYPPKDSLARDSWAGASFDRNCYEMFAPKDFWDAFKLTISDPLKVERVYILPVAESAVGSGRIYEMADFSPSALFEYLMDDEKFLKDHYVFGDSKQWACLLDQDTTLFCGDKGLMHNCFDRLGGADRVLERVLAEFGEPVSGLIEAYAERLVRGKPKTSNNGLAPGHALNPDRPTAASKNKGDGGS